MSSGAKSVTPKSVQAASGLNDQKGQGSTAFKGALPAVIKHGSQAIQQITRQLASNPKNAPGPKNNPPNLQTPRQNGSQSQQIQRPAPPRQSQTIQQPTGQTQNRQNGTRTDKQIQPAPQNNTQLEPKSSSFPRLNSRGQTQPNFEPNNSGGNSLQTNTKDFLSQSTILIRSTISQIFQSSDVHLTSSTINSLTTGKPPVTQNNAPTAPTIPNLNGSSPNHISLPPETAQIVQKITDNLTALLTNSHETNNQIVGQTVADVSRQMSREIQTVRDFLINSSVFDVKVFAELNIGERMTAAVEMLLQILPDTVLENFPTQSPAEVLNGLLLAHGIIVPQENPAEFINILDPNIQICAGKSELPINCSMTDLRDLGRLVKILIADAGAAKSFGNLDLAVQKFLKLLSANNGFDVLTAAVRIAGQPENGTLSRTLAIVQIYDLINRLLEAGEKAMKQAVNENASKTILQKDSKENFLAVSVKEKDDKALNPKSINTSSAAGSLRQFLEFNPNMTHDKSVSAFINPDDARNAQKDFSNIFQHEINDWLRSGNHRFVKDYDLEKPIGIVVERQHEDFFSATQMRLVLVRDGSIEGWHFLKSFLVR